MMMLSSKYSIELDRCELKLHNRTKTEGETINTDDEENTIN